MGELIDSHTGFTTGGTATLDVSSVVKGNGTYAFALTGTSATPAVLHSSQAGADLAPTLVGLPTMCRCSTRPPPAYGTPL